MFNIPKDVIIMACVLAPIFFIIIRIQDSFRVKKMKREVDTRNFENKIISAINNMDGWEFESFVAYVFDRLGYKAMVTQKTNDGGKDIILKKDRRTIYVECKRYAEDTLVGRPVVQKLVGSSLGDGVSNCVVVTTSSYHNTAVEYANNCRNAKVTLFDLQGLLDLCKKINKNELLIALGY